MLEAFKEIVCVDFEFVAGVGERQIPVCMVAKLLRAGRTIRLWQDEFPPEPPFPIDASTLVVAYYGARSWAVFAL